MAIEEPPQIPEERRFVWRNIEPYLAGELSEADRKRIEAYLCDCEYTRGYVECEKQFVDAVKRCVGETPPSCPDSLRMRVLEALDRCESDDDSPCAGAPEHRAGFPWPGAVLFAAACAMLVIALVMMFGSGQDETPSLYAGLAPMVTQVHLDVPEAKACKRHEADAEYRKYFAQGPELPEKMDGATLKVSSFECREVNGRRVMEAVYDAPDGERFALLIFSRDCLGRDLTKDMDALELDMQGKHVLLWREGEVFRALVGNDVVKLRRHMNELRAAV